MFKMLPIFLTVAIIGGCVGNFFLRESENPRLTLLRVCRVELPAGWLASERPAKMSALTEEPKPLRAGIFNKEKTGAKRNDLEQIKKFTRVT
jgi:hypothetical protein